MLWSLVWSVNNVGYVTENLLKDSFVVMGEENRYSWLDHNHGSSVKFVDADDSEFEVVAIQGATVISW